MNRRCFVRAVTTGAAALAAGGAASRTRAAEGGEPPARSVLEGVPRVTLEQSFTFPSSLAACLQFLRGERTCDYTALMGISGGAFGLLWSPGKWLYPANTADLGADFPEPVRRAFEAAGYEYEIVRKPEGQGGEKGYRRRIIDSIHGAGRPVLAAGVVGPPAWNIVTGYDDGGDVLIGWSSFQEFAGHGEAAESEPSGYFRKRAWYPDTHDLIVIGEEHDPPPLRTTYRRALSWAVELARMPRIAERHAGAAAYEAWAADLLRDEDFPAGNLEVLLNRLDCHFCNTMVVAEGRHHAAQLLKRVADEEPDLPADLSAAARAYEAATALMLRVLDLQGGADPNDENVARKLARHDTRSQIAGLVLEARDRENEGLEGIEQALTHMPDR
jgi:hypothetical protein